MNNKTCGGCRYFDEEVSHCERFECATRGHYTACDDFKPIEDRERKMSKKCGECRYHIGTTCHLSQGTIIMLPEKEACRHFILKPKLTVFDYITESEEKLAENFIHRILNEHDEYKWRGEIGYTDWKSAEFDSRTEALAATIEELKKEFNNG